MINLFILLLCIEYSTEMCSNWGGYYGIDGTGYEGDNQQDFNTSGFDGSENTNENYNNYYAECNYNQSPHFRNFHQYEGYEYNNEGGMNSFTQHLNTLNVGETKYQGRQHGDQNTGETHKRRGKAPSDTRKKIREQGGSSGRGKGREEEREQGKEYSKIKESLNLDIEKQYKISIYLKRFDGGTVLLLEKWNEEQVLDGERQLIAAHEQYSTINIEKVLRSLNIADVEYNENEVPVDAPNIYGKIRFNERSTELRVGKGREKNTNELARLITRWEEIRKNTEGIEPQWMTPFLNPDLPLFEPLFDGHVMVTLSDENGERYRIHWTVDRLNLYDTVQRMSYFIIEGDGQLKIIPEKNLWNKGDPIRGKRWKENEFYEGDGTNRQLLTRPLTMYQLLNIAYKKVIAGRSSHDQTPFKCRHFVYEFVTAIAQNNNDLFNFEAWPTNIRFMDQQISGVQNEHQNSELAFNQVFTFFERKYENM
ncbi:hypothetical protein Mgra_00009483 [Meloidogyne graminicola]|uniref:Uncharacterized protein n=1 Tax=Meloidogyne graminicola TaxID=189291 RepID=A0A8S9Z9T8_9BILA|nr:hypothetical protein Mgra_00009483 [Meloidogyne graminicola]